MNRTVESLNMCMACGFVGGMHSKTCPYIEDMLEQRKRHSKLEEAIDKRERDENK